MKPSARLQSAIDLLDLIKDQPRAPADATANYFFRKRRFIGGGDRRAISFLVWDVLRQWYRLHWHFQTYYHQKMADVSSRLLCGASLYFAGQKEQKERADRREAAQLAKEKNPDLKEGYKRPFYKKKKEDGFKIHSFGDVLALYNGQQYSPKALTFSERKALESLHGHMLNDPQQPSWVRLEYPQWLEPYLKATFGDERYHEMRAMMALPTLDLRVNILKTTRKIALDLLEKEGYKVSPTSLSPWGIKLPGRQNIVASQEFQKGMVEIQDEGSQLVAVAANPKPGQRVLDYCAGAAGKSLAMAMMMDNKGRLTLCDVSEPRLMAAKKRLKRADVHNLDMHLLTQGNKWSKRHKGAFDLVLVDAPCSGTGTWRRNPDARQRLTETDIKELVVKQANILQKASSFVKAGGRLVYATCSLLTIENKEQVEAFLKNNTDFSYSDPREISPLLPDKLRKEAYFSLTPYRAETDGFFVAVLKRAEKHQQKDLNKQTQEEPITNKKEAS